LAAPLDEMCSRPRTPPSNGTPGFNHSGPPTPNGGLVGMKMLDPPTNLHAKAIPSIEGYVDIRVAWTYFDFGAKWFDVRRAMDGGAMATVAKLDYQIGQSAYQYTDLQLPVSHSYQYCVRALAMGAQSPCAIVSINV
jgi:hypothetical protein